MDPREYLLRYFTDLDKIDIPIDVKDTSVGGRLSRLGSRIGTPVRNFINSKASIPNLLTPKSSTIPSPWGGSLTSSPVVNTLGGEVVDVASSAPKSFLSRVRGRLPQGVLRFAGLNNPIVRKAIGPVLDTTVGSVMDWGEGMTPIQAIGRNVTGTAFGVPAYAAGEFALPMVPFSGIPAYFLANQYGKEQFDRFYSGSDSDSTETAVAAVDEFPNDYRKPSSHLIENRGPEHLETGEGPVHLRTGEGPVHLRTGEGPVHEKVDQFLKNIDDPYIGMSTKISDKPIDTYEEFIERTKNSPAMRAGVFDPKDLYQNYVTHQDFQVARDAGNLEDFARAYPQSQTAKKMRRNAPYGRPVDF